MERSNDNKEIPESHCANVEKTKAELRHIRLSASSDRTYIDIIDVEASSSLSSLCQRV